MLIAPAGGHSNSAGNPGSSEWGRGAASGSLAFISAPAAFCRQANDVGTCEVGRVQYSTGRNMGPSNNVESQQWNTSEIKGFAVADHREWFWLHDRA